MIGSRNLTFEISSTMHNKLKYCPEYELRIKNQYYLLSQSVKIFSRDRDLVLASTFTVELSLLN